MENAAGGPPGTADGNAFINEPAAKKQRRASKGMPAMDLNAPGLFNIVPQAETNRKEKQSSSKGAQRKPPTPGHVLPPQQPPWAFKPTFKVPPNVMVYPAHMVPPPPLAPPLHPFSNPFAFPPQPKIPMAQPMFSYTGGHELIPAPTFTPLIDVKIRKLQHLATMRELDSEESSVLKALLQLQKQKMMKALEFMKLVLPEAQAKEDKPKRVLHRLERAGVKDGHVSVIALVKRRETYYVCSALDGIPAEGINAVMRLLPGEGVSKPREKATPPEERVEAVLPKPEDFEKLVRFMGTPNATSEARRKCLLSFLCHCYGGKTLHAAGYIHACNQVISAEKGTTLARKFQKANAIHELFSRKPGQGMKRKPEGEASQGASGGLGAGVPGLQLAVSQPMSAPLGVPYPMAGPQRLAPPISGPPNRTQKKAPGKRAKAGAAQNKDASAAVGDVVVEGALMRAAALDDQPGGSIVNG
ncbi:hypothetical protein KFL_000220230 [Klebsormidium nitens]|uniref:Uncharacterized protein n=1 Tax=Klebsormidium nitens TaxID=105231 RepID=A0A1Y1HMQ6_KLENI|nr:hypothetical protein KFL_000220230 [Klebsormidium nitens]|eukprot:GAQ78992.1 hypothetical protein KFL_000220230 [Klebsormidium nitens]